MILIVQMFAKQNFLRIVQNYKTYIESFSSGLFPPAYLYVCVCVCVHIVPVIAPDQ